MDEYLHLCDYASVTQDNKANVMGIFDKIVTIDAFPFTHPVPVFLAARVDTPQNVQCTFVVRMSRDGTEDYTELHTLSSATTAEFATVIFRLPPLTFPAAGLYKFEMLVNSVPRASTHIDVTTR